MARLNLLVLENPWNDSVSDGISFAPFVEGFAKWAADAVTFTRPFYGKEELRIWLEDFTRRRRGIGRRVVYVAGHGTAGRLGGLPDESQAMNFQTFSTMLKRTGGIDGVHLGCCQIGNHRNVDLLLRPDRRRRWAVPCRWVAGYRENIDWLDSMFVDLLFWRFLLQDPRRDPWRGHEDLPAISTRTGTSFAVFGNGPRGMLRDFLSESE